jgi:plastocyanin
VNSTPTAFLAIVAAVALLIFALVGALVVYDAVAGDDMMGDMWGMMDGGMMDDGMMRGGGGRNDETRGTASRQGVVRIVDFVYEPSVLEVTPDTVVNWINEDSAPHTATADDTFDTGRLDKGESGQITFDKVGTYDYICTYHSSMKGRVVVSASPR